MQVATVLMSSAIIRDCRFTRILNTTNIRSNSALAFKPLIVIIVAFILRLSFIGETSMMGDEVPYVEVGRKYLRGLLVQDLSYDLWSLNAGHPSLLQISHCYRTYRLIALEVSVYYSA